MSVYRIEFMQHPNKHTTSHHYFDLITMVLVDGILQRYAKVFYSFETMHETDVVFTWNGFYI